ncbi:MAG: hypothetical protein JO058_16190, partial [Alphaproteobacteria bacterium]|nr:hypothetical protein [Alphaproteobacteria bacterium]
MFSSHQRPVSFLSKRHLQPGVGHCGVFNGGRWQNEIYPLVRDF